MTCDTAIHDIADAARALRALPRGPETGRWSVVFADFGHAMLPLATLPTPVDEAAATELFVTLHVQGLSSYELEAPDAATAEATASAYFEQQRAEVRPWRDSWLTAAPGTVIEGAASAPFLV
ncbi:hypothetical protein GCM10010363_60330 [Streptomyces omiyaensis]|uniref:hypothetical protein n=1 Tax=Streptomyces omiyaensis TaxID=68247 RepID=UPI0016732F13|nr:hypothetical protein [Streptomyces omiyaensis]GGY71118.1 hypothetical protein GCM10010363_60330 [Streptomyces omiyaensis]